VFKEVFNVLLEINSPGVTSDDFHVCALMFAEATTLFLCLHITLGILSFTVLRNTICDSF
jgi:hypothetical protein